MALMNTEIEKLTVEQRLEAYKWAKENLRTHKYGPFICHLLSHYCDVRLDFYVSYYEQDLLNHFPEFGERKPISKKLGESWFPERGNGIKLRESLLDECIKECEQQLKGVAS